MKKLFVIGMFVFLGMYVKAQDSAYVDVVNWAGGVCCSSGERFSVHFTVAQPVYKVDSMELNIDGMGTRLDVCNRWKFIPMNMCLILISPTRTMKSPTIITCITKESTQRMCFH
jgi:hypothetical protein